RDYPWIIVLPLGVIVSVVGYLILSIIAPAAAEALLTGQGYFVKTKLYSTIAEAQPPAFSKLIVAYAMIVFFLAVIGMVKAAFQVPKHWKKEFIFIVVWAIVAVYMAMSAARFMFNATPVIAIIAGWVLYDLIKKINLKSKMLIFYTLLLGLSLLLLGWWGISHGFGYRYTLFVFMAAIAMAVIPIIVAVFDHYDKRPAIMIMVAMLAIWTLSVIVMIIMDENLKWDNFGTVLLDNINIWYFGLAALGIMVLPILIFMTKRTFAILHIVFITSITLLIIGLKDMGSFDSLFSWKPLVAAIGYSIIPGGILLFNIYFLVSDKSYRKETGRKVFFVGMELWVLSFFFNPLVYTGLAVFALFMVNLYLLAPYRKSFKHKTKPMHVIITLFIVFIVIFPTCWFAIDASLPYEKKYEMNNRVSSSIPDFIKSDTASSNKYFGAFGHGFTSEYWRNAFDWLSKQDVDRPPEERPGFVSWWDYGFWCAYLGQHPTAADNFQYGYQFAGSFIASQNESEAVGLMVARTIEGGIKDAEMKEKITAILDSEKYFGNEKKYESSLDSTKLSASEKIFEMLTYPEEYIEEIKNNPEKYGKYLQLLYGNARYAAVRGMLMPLGEDKIIDLMADVEGITDKCIRYFAVDYRLFPFTAQNTGIFYAPIKLADKDIEDFLEYLAVTTEGEMTMEELEARIEEEPEFREQVTDYKLKYTDQFYNSMFYRCYIGYSGKDLGAGDLGVPLLSPTGEFASNQYFQPMQGWNMSHFRLVYRTTYYTPKDPENASFPEDFTAMNSDEAYENYAKQGGYQISGLRQGAFFLKYYHGAQLVGKLRAEGEDGTPMPGVRITAVDEYGILHDVAITDENGNYNLTLPFGEVTVVASKDGFDEENELFSKLMGNEKNILNQTVLQISDDQAMRRGDWIIKKDLTVKRSSLNGKVYFDENNDGEYDNFDRLAEEAVVEIVSSDGREITYNDNIENGEFNLTNVLPAEYDFKIMTEGHTVNIKDPFSVDPNVNERFNMFTLNLLIPQGNISGNISFSNGTRAPSINVELRDNENGTIYHTDTNQTGHYDFGSLLPGNYSVVVDHTLYKRIMTELDLEEGSLAQHNFTLTEVVPVSGEVYYEAINDNEEPLPNARVQFINELYPENIIVVTTDQNGQYLANLSLGNYTIYADYTRGGEHYTCLEEAEFRAGFAYSRDIELTRSIKIMGTLGIDDEIEVDDENSTEGVLVRFRGEGANYFVPTNESSYFSTYLPEGEYQISADLFLKGDFGVAAKHIAGTGGEEFTVNLIANWANPVYGFVFWDRNGDMNLTIGNKTIDIIALTEQYRETEPELDDIGDTEQGEETPTSVSESIETGTRADENVSEDEEIPLNVGNVTIENATNDTVETPLLYENLTPAHVEFRQGENVFRADTNVTGFFTRLLPLGDFNMRIETDEIALFETTITVAEGKDDLILPPVKPNNVTFDIFLGVDRDLDGLLQEEELLKSYELEFTGSTPGAVNASYNFRKGTPKEGSLVPGEYEVRYLKEFTLSGTDVRQRMETNITLNLGESDRELNFLVNETVRFSGEVKTETDLPAVNATLILRSILSNTTTEIICDSQGKFDEYVPFGMYFVRTRIIEGTSNFLFREIMDISPGNSPFPITLIKAHSFNITVFFDKNQDGGFQGAEKLINVPVIISADITSTHTTDYNGFITTSLLPGKTYNISMDHLTSDSSFKYTAKETVVMPDGPYEIYLPISKYIKVKGKSYWDKDNDNTFDGGEEIADADLSFSALGNSGDYAARSNADGQWNVFLPISLDNKQEYEFSIEANSFDPDVFIKEVSISNKTFDIALEPRKLEYRGIVFRDTDNNDSLDPDELPALYNTIIKFSTNSETGENTNASTDANGNYKIELYPGEYLIEILSVDDEVYMYETKEIVILGEDKLYNIPMVPGANVYGAVKYLDTDSVEHREIDSQDNNLTIKGVGNDITRELEFQEGFYETYLPYGEYKFEMKGYTSNEYGMDMVYEFPETDYYIDYNPFAMDLQLSKVYDRTLELSVLEVVDDETFETTINQGEAVEIHLRVENKGNVMQDISVNGKDLPEGWSTDITPRDRELDIGESFEVKLVIRSSFDSLGLNEITIEVKNEVGDVEDVTLNINTHPKYDVEVYSQDLLDRGFLPNETKRFNITVMNKGNTGDDIKFYLKQDSSPLW
ncbi:MAG: carboxypeptidase regulatory-like domain-containing protein, partial [Candidatus Thermoplasmatota archaeon]|nr:carboxypeptidase regulatory-like domain-containing protein [Candidatus Thermoplasmatota archaeon]